MLIHTQLTQDSEFEKIGATIYWQPKSRKIYKLAFLPSSAVFINNDVMQPLTVSLTEYNPYFLAINKLIANKIDLNHVPEHLKGVHFERIADQEEHYSTTFFVINRNKVFDYLETKVAQLHKCFEDNFELNYIKTEEKEKKFITDDIVTILKAEINDHLLIEIFAKERYGYKPDRKKLMEEEEEEQFAKKSKSKPKKDSKKSEPKIEYGQKTLNMFMKPKK